VDIGEDGVLLKVAILTIAIAGVAHAQPSAVPPEMQPQVGPGASHATFASTSAMRWEVIIGETLACVTPCAMWVPPLEFVTLPPASPSRR
jgi:hypothetical protein